MSTASKALRRQLEVAALFGEAQERGREWFTGVCSFRDEPTSPPPKGRRRSTKIPYATRRLRASRIVEAVRSGLDRADVAQAFGVSHALVCQYARAAGLPPPLRRQPDVSKQLAEAHARRARLFDALDRGADLTKAARLADLSTDQAAKLARRAGRLLAPGKDGRARPGRNEAILDALLARERTADVARRFGLTYHGLYTILRRRGLRLGHAGRSGCTTNPPAPPAFARAA